MNFVNEAMANYTSVLKKYVEFNGRASRKEYWMFVLVNFIVSILLGIIERSIGMMGTISNIYSLAVLLPAIAVLVRRMHDTDKSGWFMLIPIYNLILACTAGTKGNNRFGADPKGMTESTSNQVL